MRATLFVHAIPRSLSILPEAASGWLRFGITALPKTAPPSSSR